MLNRKMNYFRPCLGGQLLAQLAVIILEIIFMILGQEFVVVTCVVRKQRRPEQFEFFTTNIANIAQVLYLLHSVTESSWRLFYKTVI